MSQYPYPKGCPMPEDDWNKLLSNLEKVEEQTKVKLTGKENRKYNCPIARFAPYVTTDEKLVGLAGGGILYQNPNEGLYTLYHIYEEADTVWWVDRSNNESRKIVFKLIKKWIKSRGY